MHVAAIVGRWSLRPMNQNAVQPAICISGICESTSNSQQLHDESSPTSLRGQDAEDCTTEVSTRPAATVFPTRLRCPFLIFFGRYTLIQGLHGTLFVRIFTLLASYGYNIHHLYTVYEQQFLYAPLAIYSLNIIWSTLVHPPLSCVFQTGYCITICPIYLLQILP